MDDVMDRMLQLAQKGYSCSQILLLFALESQGKEDPDLVRAMHGLHGGLGGAGNLCGTLTGGACFLSYFTGKGSDEEQPHPQMNEMVQELLHWFEEFTSEYGGITCHCILGGDRKNMMQRCPMVVHGVLEECMNILERHEVFDQ